MGYSLGRAKCRHGNGVRTSFLRKPGMARRLAGRHALPSPTMQGQPGRARVAGYLAATLALKAGPVPLPPHARSNSGAGPPMASASPGGERATLPGAVLAVGGPVLCAVTLKPRPCGGRLPPHLSHGWLLPGRTRARRSLRPRLLPRAGGGASRADGPLLAGHGWA